MFQNPLIIHNMKILFISESVTAKNSIVLHENQKFLNDFQQPCQAWVENLETTEEKHFGLVNLHPQIFGQIPRLDLVTLNIEWQKKYKWVSYENTKVTNEVERTGRKPWPQKGKLERNIDSSAFSF